jgi:hypothetical protein
MLRYRHGVVLTDLLKWLSSAMISTDENAAAAVSVDCFVQIQGAPNTATKLAAS